MGYKPQDEAISRACDKIQGGKPMGKEPLIHISPEDLKRAKPMREPTQEQIKELLGEGKEAKEFNEVTKKLQEERRKPQAMP